MESLPVEIIVELRKNGLTFKEISSKLQQNYPQQRGFSERSVRRYCKERNIERMDDDEVDEVVEEAAKEVYIIMLLDKNYTAII